MKQFSTDNVILFQIKEQSTVKILSVKVVCQISKIIPKSNFIKKQANNINVFLRLN